MWIAFEGHDGSGKTSTAEMLADRLREAGKSVLFLQLPGSTKFGSYVRNTWHPNDRVRFLQLLANHVEVIEDVILPHLDNGGWVVQDRTYLSNIVYLGWAGPISVEYVYTACKLWITKVPHKLFIFECDVKTAMDRLASLSKDLADPDPDSLHNIRAAYRLEGKVANAKFINTEKDQLSVLNECLSEIGVV